MKNNVLKELKTSILEVLNNKLKASSLTENNKKLFSNTILKQVTTLFSQLSGESLSYSSVSSVIDELNQQFDKQKSRVLFNTSFKKLNSKIMGFKEGELIIIGARPMMGKTAMLNSLLLSLEPKVVSLYFPLKHDAKNITQKLISNLGNIPLATWSSQNSLKENRPNIEKASKQLKKQNILFADPHFNLEDIEHQIRKCTQEMDAKLIIIDEFQLINLNRKSRSRTDELTKIVATLKQVAIEEKVCMIITSHLSRAVESRPDKQPQLSDLSGYNGSNYAAHFGLSMPGITV